MNTKPVPYSGNAPYIFVSYSHKDHETVYPIIMRMQLEGYRVWYDEGIDPGTIYAQNITDHIDNCQYFIAFATGNFYESDFCQNEIDYARSLKKNLLIIYLNEDTVPGPFRLLYGRIQAINRYNYDESGFSTKLSSTKGIDKCKAIYPLETMILPDELVGSWTPPEPTSFPKKIAPLPPKPAAAPQTYEGQKRVILPGDAVIIKADGFCGLKDAEVIIVPEGVGVVETPNFLDCPELKNLVFMGERTEFNCGVFLSDSSAAIWCLPDSFIDRYMRNVFDPGMRYITGPYEKDGFLCYFHDPDDDFSPVIYDPNGEPIYCDEAEKLAMFGLTD